jgi:hypothetical protein
MSSNPTLKQTVTGGIIATVVGGVILWWIEPVLKPTPATQTAQTQPYTSDSVQVSTQVQSPDKHHIRPPVVSKPPLPEPDLPSRPTTPEAIQNTEALQTPYAIPASTSSSSRTLDGQWFSVQFQYGFKIQGDIGIATLSNSPNFAPGDVILRFERQSEIEFRGEQIFTDGNWYAVSGRQADANTLAMTGGGQVWTMSKQ